MEMRAKKYWRTRLELNETERSIIQDAIFLLVAITDAATDRGDNCLVPRLYGCVDLLEELLDYESEFPVKEGEN